MIYIRQQGQWFCWLLASSAAGGGSTFPGCGRPSVCINLSGHPDCSRDPCWHNSDFSRIFGVQAGRSWDAAILV